MTKDPTDDALWRIPDALDFATALSELRAEQRREMSALLLSLLAVMDSFDRLLTDAPEGDDGGEAIGTCRLITRQLLAALKSVGVHPLECMGAMVDPRTHEVIGVRHVAPSQQDVILDVLQRGYEWGGQLLRPAKVIIGRSIEESLG